VLNIKIPQLVAAVHLNADGRADYLSTDFKREIVKFGLDSWLIFHWDNSIDTDQHAIQAYKGVKMELSSIRLQISNKCLKFNPHCFTWNDKTTTSHFAPLPSLSTPFI
jgi:hypothetical protein